MASKKTTTPKSEEKVDTAELVISYVPLGEHSELKLTVNVIRKFLVVRTKSGKTPDDADIMKFMMLCKARELNPWVGDAYLIGYDTEGGQGPPTFTLITAIQALAKRAEVNKSFNGIESGVIVKDKESGEVVHRAGDFLFEDEKLLGAWCRVYRNDRDKPFYQALKLSVYDTGRSRWKADPAGMIVKCAEAGAYRMAFPTQLGELYTQEERGTIGDQGDLPDMPQGRQEFGFKQIAGADPVDEEPQAQTKTETDGQPRITATEIQERTKTEPEPTSEPEPQPEPKPKISQNAKAEVAPKAISEKSIVDQRLQELYDHVEKAIPTTPEEALAEISRWLKRLGYDPPTKLADDKIWNDIVWKRAVKKWSLQTQQA